MRIDIATLFPEMCERGGRCESIIGRARRKRGSSESLRAINIRDYTQDDRTRRVDDTPYGGGMGMVIAGRAASPAAMRGTSVPRSPKKPHVIYLSPQGRVF